jgi:heat shock protein HslJ
MRLMFPLGLSALIVGLVIVIAIGIDSLESPLDGLEGTWVPMFYGEPGKPRVPCLWRDITLTISACVTAEQKIGVCATCENRIGSFTGTNSCVGCYEMDGNKFSTYTVHGEEKYTGRICAEAGGPPHLMAQEDRYLDILTSAETYEIKNGRLIISSGKEVLVFRWKGIISCNEVSSAGT